MTAKGISRSRWRFHLGRDFLVPRLGVAVGDGAGAGDDGLVDLLRIHQPQEGRRRVVPERAEREMSEVGVDVDDHALRPSRSLSMFPPRIFAFSAAPRSAPRIRPTAGGHGHVAAEEQAVDAEHPRRHLHDAVIR